MNQPNEQVTQQAAQNHPGAGYSQGYEPRQQAVYQPYTVYQPYPAPQYQAPGFSIKRRDPRKAGALSTLNKLGLLMVARRR